MLIAWMRVVFRGLKSDWCKNLIAFCRVVIVYALAANCCCFAASDNIWRSYTSTFCCGLVCAVMGSVHNPIVGSLLPTNISFISWYTLHSFTFMSKITRHPPSHNFLRDIKDVWARPGTMCASTTDFGSHGMSSLHVCVEYIFWPSGSIIAIGFALL